MNHSTSQSGHDLVNSAHWELTANTYLRGILVEYSGLEFHGQRNVPDGFLEMSLGRASSAAAAETAPDFATFYLNRRLSYLTVVVKEDAIILAEAQEVDHPPCKRPRVSSSVDDHADVRCALLTVASPNKAVRLILSTRQHGGTEATATRIPGHKMVLWGRSGFFRSKVMGRVCLEAGFPNIGRMQWGFSITRGTPLSA